MTVDKLIDLVPKLRFPQFQYGVGWGTPHGDVLFQVINNRNASPGLPVLAITQEHGAIPRDQINYHVSVTAESVASYKEVCRGDFIISLRSFQGGIEYSQHHGICSPAYIILRRKGAGNDHFFRHMFKSYRFIQQLTRNIEGLRDGKMISYAQFSEQRLLVPEPPEQQRIADCLDSLDALIVAEGEKLNALRTHKEGLMQELFPKDGAAVPHLRFPEFRDKGQWEERNAGSLFVNRIKKGEVGLPIYSVTMHDGMVRRDSSERNYYDIEEAAGNKQAFKNDLAYNMMRMWQGALGVAPEDCLVSPAYIVLSPQDNVVSQFFEYLFKLPATMLLLTSYSRGLTKDRLRLYYDDFARVPLRCPSWSEQQRIADCLSSLDTRINKQAKKLNILGLHKQGLLQQLFPDIEKESR